jgi:hypothetical protein
MSWPKQYIACPAAGLADTLLSEYTLLRGASAGFGLIAACPGADPVT